MDKFLKRVIYDVLCITLHIIGYLCSDVYCTQIIHGGSQFRGMWYNLYSYKSRLFIQGNQSKAFLSKLSELEAAFEKEGVSDQGLPYISVLKSFSQVVDTCFGVTLLPEYQTHIKDFKENYLSLGLSVTPKVK